jgi:hypothetical protein
MARSDKQLDRAKALGFELSEIDGGWTATWTDQNVTVDAKTPKAALDALEKVKRTMVEFPHVRIEQVEGGWRMVRASNHDEILEAESGPEDEEERKGSIVPQRYRSEYKARGDATCCGDWLANFLKEWTGQSFEQAYALNRANGLDREWRNLNNGQQRMNAGNMLRSKLLKSPDTKLRLPNGDEIDCGDWRAETLARLAAKKAAKV